jgi:hypothetical protein
MKIIEFATKNTSHESYGAYCRHLLNQQTFTDLTIREVDRLRAASNAGKPFPRHIVDQFFADFKEQRLQNIVVNKPYSHAIR